MEERHPAAAGAFEHDRVPACDPTQDSELANRRDLLPTKVRAVPKYGTTLSVSSVRSMRREM